MTNEKHDIDKFNRFYTEAMGDKKNTVHYGDIIGSGEFFGHRNDGDPVFAHLEKIVIEQAKASIVYGKPVGFAGLCSLAYQGKANEAVKEVEEKTRRDESSLNVNVCTNKYKELYEGANTFRGTEYTDTRKSYSNSGECGCPISYIDACLFGARMAEVNKDIKNAKLLYERAKKVIDMKIKYSDYSDLFKQREKTIMSAFARIKDKTLLEKGKELLRKLKNGGFE